MAMLTRLWWVWTVRLDRHLLQAVNYWLLRTQAFQVWQDVLCA